MIAFAAALALATPAGAPPVSPPAVRPAVPPPAQPPSGSAMPLSAVAHLLLAAPPAAADPVSPAPAAQNPAPPAPAPPAPAPPDAAPPAPPPRPEAAPPPPPAARTPGDPDERFNRRMFARYQRFDRAVLGPAAMGYKHAVPRPVRSGIRHFFQNLTEPVVFVNFLLQHRIGKAFETLGRFVINSTVGVGGLVDVAKAKGIDLPHRPNGFADTLGFYGVKPGAFLFLPLVGPTTVRDLIGGQIDAAVLPLSVGKPFTKLYYQLPHAVLTGLDDRAQADGDLKTLYATAVDPYATLRSVYLQDRAAEIAALHGPRAGGGEAAKAPAGGELGDPLVDPAAPGTAPPPGSSAPELGDPLTDPAAPATATPAPVADPATPARR